MRKLARLMALTVKVLGAVPNCLVALWMMAAERDWRPGQQNRNNGTIRFRRMGGYINYTHEKGTNLPRTHCRPSLPHPYSDDIHDADDKLNRDGIINDLHDPSQRAILQQQ